MGAVPGVAIGNAAVWESETLRPQFKPSGDPQEEIARLVSAVDETKRQLRDLMDKVAVQVGEQEAKVFKTHLALLGDPMLMNEVDKNIRSGHLCAEEAVERAVALLVEKFQALKDIYLRERVADIKDVGDRLLKNLICACAEEACAPDASIICAANLTPSETCLLDPQKVLGIVIAEGGVTSHAAIFARALNIPTVVGVKGVLAKVHNGDSLIVDGRQGEVIVRPDERTTEVYYQRWAEECNTQKELTTLKDLPAITLDGCRIEVAANIGGPGEVPAALSAGAEGIGLLRTEFLFFYRNTLPSEEEQFTAYRDTLSQMAPRRVVVRTMDVGGDKELPHLHLLRESNPFLGLRGIRLSLEREESFHIQLRALLKASQFGNLAIMLPMVSDIAEVRRTKELIAGIGRELAEAGDAVADVIPLGIMVETPAAALMTEDWAEEVDFFSIGTNDLTQYVLAVDRLNEKVSHLYQPFHPAVRRLIQGVAHAAGRKGKWVGVCGEMAAEPLAVPLLVGMGVNELSVSPGSIPLVKNLVRGMNKTESAVLAQKMLKLKSANEVLEQLKGFRGERA